MRRMTACLLLVCACGQAPERAPAAEVTPEPLPAEEAAPVAEEPAEAPAAAEPAEPALPPLAFPEELRFPPGDFTHAEILDAIGRTPSRQFKPVGTTSVVFRMRLRSEHTAAFKPRSRQHRAGHLKEVAAYRLARMLALENVPPATVRRVPLGRIRDRMHRRYDDEETWEEIRDWVLVEGSGQLPGAAIYWIPAMANLRLERPEAMREWRPWLTLGEPIPEAKRALARDLSRMLAFDYLIANWDRLSGGNMSGLEDGSRLLVRDHNVAFAAPLPEEVHARVLGRLRFAQRFSRAFIERVRRLDREALERALRGTEGEEEVGEPLLGPAQIAGVLERRRVLLSYVGALIDEHGEEAVLAFE
ncbi:MAG TPA: hypothetical protein RMH85_03135 [Polyangiaceae bacterium LLY-WYZ-15_(1-7)]|nr:hypothetical protein [Sandaracinus sp.]HJK94222.1 hypothetical protein [Polyangiaceae bacterium LLY-WYZ-15_(1-7)]HJL03372.1 hypothetical protein [Polyangiaceae bacterium LLY-WYZ-15_(1-7)]HJL07458.1 hypothetical protein [Polyangiaceae bacterium LLY-WYZ-15_(1-7)]HJL35887.1 hypothetical protein [Polyangiaceae bacterium LLY-WYZ-15_(1-7)]